MNDTTVVYLTLLRDLGLPPTDPNTAVALGGTLVMEAPQTAHSRC
jgi:hypothetical protein